jgi:hypothetical protein
MTSRRATSLTVSPLHRYHVPGRDSRHPQALCAVQRVAGHRSGGLVDGREALGGEERCEEGASLWTVS